VLIDLVIGNQNLCVFFVSKVEFVSGVLNPAKTCEKMIFEFWNKILLFLSNEIIKNFLKKNTPLLLDHPLAVY
jgi:hypothetical protein